MRKASDPRLDGSRPAAGGEPDTRRPAEEDVDLLGPLQDAGRALSRLARIEWQRFTALFKATRRRVLLAVWEIVFIAVLTVTGSIVLVQGITGGLGALLGAQWAGELAAAVVILGGAIAFAAVRTSRRDRAEHKSLCTRLDIEEK